MRLRVFILLIFFVALVSRATTIYSFDWDASTDPSVFDYRLYWGFFQSQELWMKNGVPCTPGTTGCVDMGVGSAARLDNMIDVGNGGSLTGSITVDWSQDTDAYLVAFGVTVVGWDGTQEIGPSNCLRIDFAPSPTPTATPSPTPSPSPPPPTPTPTPSPSPTPSPTPTPAPTPTPTPTPSPTPSPTSTPSPTPSASPSPTPTPTPIPPQCVVPNFIGMKLRRAQGIWNEAGFKTIVTTVGPQGHAIKSQSLPANSLGSCATATITVNAQ